MKVFIATGTDCDGFNLFAKPSLTKTGAFKLIFQDAKTWFQDRGTKPEELKPQYKRLYDYLFTDDVYKRYEMMTKDEFLDSWNDLEGCTNYIIWEEELEGV